MNIESKSERIFLLLCLNKKGCIFNVCVLSKSPFTLRDSAGEFSAAP